MTITHFTHDNGKSVMNMNGFNNVLSEKVVNNNNNKKKQ